MLAVLVVCGNLYSIGCVVVQPLACITGSMWCVQNQIDRHYHRARQGLSALKTR